MVEVSLTARSTVTVATKKKSVPFKTKSKAPANRRGSTPLALSPVEFKTPESVEKLSTLDVSEKKELVLRLVSKALGEQTLLERNKPHSASQTRDRAGAAADVATIAKNVGLVFVLKECGVLNTMTKMLIPDGLEVLLASYAESSIKPSPSMLSLASLGDDTTVTSFASDSRRGKSTPATAREGSLLLIRAFCEIVGRAAEPFVVTDLLVAALDECGSKSSDVRTAAEDATTCIVRLAHAWTFPRIVCPALINGLSSSEWRVKQTALELLSQCAATKPKQVSRLLPQLIPPISSTVWDTKPQVTKAARATLLAICQTNSNPDVSPAIPAVVNAMCKPSETVKAIQELMATTFVAPVDASTLSILCPVLSRGLKEKLAINKRATCIVISNMSRLVYSPEDVAPFGPLLVPELKKVAENVQFEEIRDAALSALQDLTKALGSTPENDVMNEINDRVVEEQEKISTERDEEAKREEEKKKLEEEERRKFKEAMDAQRELDKLQAKAEEEKKTEKFNKREQQRRGVKGSGGKCQGCGLKKCKKTCLFNKG